MSFENFEQEKYSENGSMEMSELLLRPLSQKYQHAYETKIKTLLGHIETLKKYITAKEKINPLEEEVDKLRDHTNHGTYGDLISKSGELSTVKRTIEQFESENNVPEEGGIQQIKDLLDELIEQTKLTKIYSDKVQEQLKDSGENPFNLN